jgi:MoxR-like ATPase
VVITLLGAQGSGKTWLARALAEALAASQPGLQIVESAAPPAFTPADKVLLMGLDLPPSLHSVVALQEAQDAQLRAALAQAGVAFQVVYGTGPARLRNALAALEALARLPTGNTAHNKPAAWRWHCDACSDPDCEHRLFTSLQAQRLTGVAAARPAG